MDCRHSDYFVLFVYEMFSHLPRSEASFFFITGVGLKGARSPCFADKSVWLLSWSLRAFHHVFRHFFLLRIIFFEYPTTRLSITYVFSSEIMFLIKFLYWSVLEFFIFALNVFITIKTTPFLKLKRNNGKKELSILFIKHLVSAIVVEFEGFLPKITF